MDDSHILSIPTHLLQKIVRYSTVRIQWLFLQNDPQLLSAKWKYGVVSLRVALISSEDCKIALKPGLLPTGDNSTHRFLSFTRNYIFTESKAYCTRTGRIVESSDDVEDGVTATTYSPRGFIIGWRDGSVWFPASSHRHCGRGNEQITIVTTYQNRVFTGSESGECLEWTVGGDLVQSVFQGSAAITGLCADGSMVAIGSANGDIILAFIEECIYLRAKAPTAAFALATNQDFVFTGHEDGRVRVWTVSGLRLTRVMQTGGVVTAVSVNMDLMAVGMAGGLVELYNWQTGEFVKTFPNEHRQMVTKITIDGDMIVSASLDGQVISRQCYVR